MGRSVPSSIGIQHHEQPSAVEPAVPEWRWLLALSRPVARFQGLSLICILSASLLALVDPLIMKWLIDDVLPRRHWQLVPVAALCVFAAIAGRAVLQAIGGLMTLAGSQRLIFDLRRRLLEHVQALPPAFHAVTPVGELLQRVERDVDQVGELGTDLLPAIVRMTMVAACVILAMLVLSPRLTLLVLPLVPLFLLLRHHYREALNRASERVRRSAGQQTSFLTELLAGAVQLQLLGAERKAARTYAMQTLGTLRATMARKRAELRFTLTSTTIIAAGMSVVLGYGGWQVIAGALTTGGLVAFHTYLLRLFEPLSTGIELLARLHRVRASIHRIRELEEQRSPLRDRPHAQPFPGPGPATITLDRVSFRYRPDALALHDVDVRFAAGDRVALVGASGGGKSTLVHLIARLADAECGIVRWDDRDVRDVTLKSLRGAISLVPQAPVLFKGTLRDNLRYARPDATSDDLDRAAHEVCLHEVVERLPGGWDHELGPFGAGLSGGERQRVALARAVLQDRPVVILDEATSAMDAPTEQRILGNLAPWSARKIVIVISHRISAARWADRVVVLHGGLVVEEGTHETLCRTGSHYFSLWRRAAVEGGDDVEEMAS